MGYLGQGVNGDHEVMLYARWRRNQPPRPQATRSPGFRSTFSASVRMDPLANLIEIASGGFDLRAEDRDRVMRRRDHAGNRQVVEQLLDLAVVHLYR